MTTTTTTVKTPSRKPRKSPIDSAIVSAEKTLGRATRRKLSSQRRLARLQSRIALIVGSSGQFDTLIKQLSENVENLRKMKSAAAQD